MAHAQSTFLSAELHAGSKTGYVLKNGHPEGEFSELLPTIPRNSVHSLH
jgi:hypothetical protein